MPINEFRDAMTKSLEKQLQEHDETLSEQDCKIVDITFSFNNTTLFEKLEARAKALKAGNFSDLVQIQNDMTKIKDRNFDQMVTPNLMWVTFEMGAG